MPPWRCRSRVSIAPKVPAKTAPISEERKKKKKGKEKKRKESEVPIAAHKSRVEMCSPVSISLFLLILQTLTVLSPIQAIIVDVPSGKVKCLTEDLRKGTLSYAQYRVVNASASHLTISSRVIHSSTNYSSIRADLIS